MSFVCLTIAGVKIDLIASKFKLNIQRNILLYDNFIIFIKMQSINGINKWFYKWKNEIYKKKFVCGIKNIFVKFY